MNCQWLTLTKGSACVHCGRVLPKDFNKAPYAACGKPQPMPVGPCRFLGQPTGTMLKQSCPKKADIAEHFCYCPQRMIYGKRAAAWLLGVCTAEAPCQDDSVIQYCGRCPRRQPQLLLTKLG